MKSRLIPFLLLLSAAGAPMLQAYSTSFYASSSRLSSGHWVKVATDAEGIFQLSYDQLREMGFEDPSKVQVYGYGSTQFADNLFIGNAPDDIIPTATLHTPDGRILFFGQGDVSVSVNSLTGSEASRYNVRRNYYDTRSYYFLSDAEGVQPVPQKPEQQPSAQYSPLDFHIHLDYFEDEIQTPINGGVGYHGAEVSPGACIPYDVRIRNFHATDTYPSGIFNYFVAVSASRSTRLSTRTEGDIDSLAGTVSQAWSIADGEYTAYSDARGSVSFTASDARPLTDTKVRFNVQIPSDITPRYVAPDRAAVRYPRTNIIDDTDPMLIINYTRAESMSGQQVLFAEVGSADELAVWSIDNLTGIAAYPTVYDAASRTMSYVLTENYTRRNVVFRPSAQYPSPAVVGAVAAQNLHGSATPDMLIITTPEYLAAATRLADAHAQYQGLAVKVVLQDEIFNEFSSGARDAMAYRRYAKMYFDRRPEKFRYMLIFGPCSYDNRSLEVAPADRLLTYQNTLASQTANTITNYASDNYFGMLADDYNHDNIHLRDYNIAVGRVSAMNPAQAEDYVDKAVRYLSTPPDYRAYGRALLCAGEGDRNTHLSHSNEVADSMLTYRPDFTIINVPNQLYRQGRNDTNTAFRDIVRQELQRGVGYFTYSGHGDPNFIGNASQWNRSYATSVEYPTMPFVMFSSCDQYSYDRNLNCLIEAMLFSPRGGCLAGVGASRSVYISYNQLSCLSVARAYAEAGPDDTYGDVYMRARRHVLELYNDGKISTPDEALVNTLIYNLAGDPALPLYAPECSAVIAEIDGHDPAEGDVEVMPLKPFHIKGSIAGVGGATDHDFNGVATVRILAAGVTNTTYNTNGENNYTGMDVTQQFATLAEVETDVRDGQFDAVLTAPVPVPVGQNRLMVYACDKTDGRMALASFDDLTVGDFNPADHDDNDLSAPEIRDFRAGDPDFVSGSEQQADVLLTATIDPSAFGLDFSDGNIATRTSITVDDLRSIDRLDRFVSRNDDGTLTLATTVSGLSEGIHSVTLTVANNVGQVDRSTIDFVVVSRLDRPAVTTDDHLARESATFDLTPAVGSANTLFITDGHGNTVRRIDGVVFPYRWDLNDSAGNPVADGPYIVTALIRDGQDYTHSHPASIVVLR